MTAVSGAEAVHVLEHAARDLPVVVDEMRLYPDADVIHVDPADRPAWLEARRAGLGSSDAPSIVGLDRFRSPFAVWADKVYGASEEENPAMIWGNRLEAAVAEHYADENAVVLLKPSVMWRSRECPVAFANPDRLILAGERPPPILEIKTSRLSDEWAGDLPPDRVLVQVQWQLGVTGAPRATVAVLLHGREYRTFEVERDAAAIAFLWQAAADFWARVESGTPPPVDGTESTAAALRDLYAAVDPGATVELDSAGLDLVHRLAETRVEKKRVEERETEIANELRLLLGHSEIAVVDGVEVLTAKAQTRTEIDVKQLRDERPRLAAALLARYPKRAVVRPLRPKGGTR